MVMISAKIILSAGRLFAFVLTGLNVLSAPLVSALENSDQVESNYQNTVPPSLIDPLESRQRLISMTVITEKDIKRCPGCDLPEILSRAGVQVRRHHLNFSESSDTDVSYVALRGYTEAQTILVVDGLRQEDVMLSEPVWTFIPVHHIKRIEIVKGPSIMYGSPIGGVVHIITKKAECPPEKSACLDMTTEFSNESNTGQTGYSSAHVRSESGLSGFRLGIQGDHSSDPKKSGSYREKALTMNFDLNSEDRRWRTEGSAVVYDSDSSGKPKLNEPRGGSQIVRLGSSYYVSPNLLFDILIGHNRETQNYLSFNNSEDIYTSRRLTLKALGRYTFDFKEGKYELAVGLENQRERISSHPEYFPGAEEPIYPQKKRTTKSAFARVDGSSGPFIYQVAARTDDISGDTVEGLDLERRRLLACG